MENAKKNLVFHFGGGRQASFYQVEYVNSFSIVILSNLRVQIRITLFPGFKNLAAALIYVNKRVLNFRLSHVGYFEE